MEDEEITLDSVEPSWMEDGGGIIGDQPDFTDDYTQEWDTEARTIGGEPDDDYQPPGGSTLTVQTRDAGGFGTIIQQVTGVNTITFDSAVFLIQDNGGGEVVVYCAS